MLLCVLNMFFFFNGAKLRKNSQANCSLLNRTCLINFEFYNQINFVFMTLNKGILILISFLFFNFTNIPMKNNFGKLKFKVITDKSQGVWDLWNFTLVNDSTKIKLPLSYKKWSKFDSIPIGKYKIQYYSVFGDKFENEIEIKPKTKFILDLSTIYKYDYSDSLFLDNLTDSQVLKVEVEITGCFGGTQVNDYFFTNINDTFRIDYYSDSGIVTNRILSEEELLQFKKLERRLRDPNSKYLSFQMATYYLSVNNKMIKRRMNGGDDFGKILNGIRY
jgi:hypothetical protein